MESCAARCVAPRTTSNISYCSDLGVGDCGAVTAVYYRRRLEAVKSSPPTRFHAVSRTRIIRGRRRIPRNCICKATISLLFVPLFSALLIAPLFYPGLIKNCLVKLYFFALRKCE